MNVAMIQPTLFCSGQHIFRAELKRPRPVRGQASETKTLASRPQHHRKSAESEIPHISVFTDETGFGATLKSCLSCRVHPMFWRIVSAPALHNLVTVLKLNSQKCTFVALCYGKRFRRWHKAPSLTNHRRVIVTKGSRPAGHSSQSMQCTHRERQRERETDRQNDVLEWSIEQ